VCYVFRTILLVLELLWIKTIKFFSNLFSAVRLLLLIKQFFSCEMGFDMCLWWVYGSSDTCFYCFNNHYVNHQLWFEYHRHFACSMHRDSKPKAQFHQKVETTFYSQNLLLYLLTIHSKF
jgi:hypothetical protein